MRVFVSWSGPRSQKVGEALSKFIRRVLQRTDPWYSKNSIRSGRLAYDELVKALNGTKFGILCVTADNLQKPWLNFEAGALLRSVEATQVTPYLLGMKPSQLTAPLNMFQARGADHDDTLELCHDLNAALGQTDHFEMWWPMLEKALLAIEPTEAKAPEGPGELELLRDIHAMLSSTRSNSAQAKPASTPVPIVISGVRVDEMTNNQVVEMLAQAERNVAKSDRSAENAVTNEARELFIRQRREWWELGMQLAEELNRRGDKNLSG